jgi:hypothetical protein
LWAHSVRQSAQLFKLTRQAEGREIMMHPYSPSPRWLAVPGIGFPQNISVRPNVLDPEDFRDWSFMERRKEDVRHEASTSLIDCIASRSSLWPWLSARW